MRGVEALLRWNNPNLGLVPPDRFLPLAERSGLIVPIGNWVINEACRQMVEWHTMGQGELSIAVNLSTVQLANGGLVEFVRTAPQSSGLPARFLTLEVTESTAKRDAEVSLNVLNLAKIREPVLTHCDSGKGRSPFVADAASACPQYQHMSQGQLAAHQRTAIRTSSPLRVRLRR